VPKSETSHILRSLIVGRGPVRFGRATAIIATGPGEALSWWIAIFDAQPDDFRELGGTVAVRALTSAGMGLAGRAKVDCITPACRFVGLRGVGPVLVG
jgi:hypothetical protein